MNENKPKKISSYIVGIIVITFVVIGVISSVNFIAEKIRQATDDTPKLMEYQAFIAPVVMNDPDTFDDVSKANTSQLIAISIWSILNDDLSPDKYESASGGILIPQKDIEKRLSVLFGSEVKPQHATVDGGGVEFKYSAKKKGYIIPITGIEPIYTPTVLSADEKGNTVILNVGYIASEDFAQDENGSPIQPEPAKIMRITLRKNSDETYFVSAIQAVQTS